MGFAIDGEYVNLGILKHFVDLNLIDDAVGQYYEIWDPAHVIERAVLDGFKKAPLLEKFIKRLQEIVKQVQYGNAFEQLLKAAETIEIARLKPKYSSQKNLSWIVRKFIDIFFTIIKLLLLPSKACFQVTPPSPVFAI